MMADYIEKASIHMKINIFSLEHAVCHGSFFDAD